MTYKERISETVFSLFAIEKSEIVFSFFEKEPPFIVSWSHYLQLMRIENEAERSFYEIETAKTGWGVRILQRQYNSSLYERLALSRDRNIVGNIPVDRILIESDAPFTKGLNEKYTIAFNDEIYKYIGELYHQEIDVVKKRVKANFAEVLKNKR